MVALGYLSRIVEWISGCRDVSNSELARAGESVAYRGSEWLDAI